MRCTFIVNLLLTQVDLRPTRLTRPVHGGRG
jgi:hypothetical protein